MRGWGLGEEGGPVGVEEVGSGWSCGREDGGENREGVSVCGYSGLVWLRTSKSFSFKAIFNVTGF